MDVACPHCHALHWKSEHLVSSSNQNPAFGMCCDQGQVRIPALRDPPEALRNLFEAHTPEAQYNAALAFTLLGINIDCQVNNGRGPYVFRVHGELSHQIGDLMPTEGQQPHNHDLNQCTMDKLQTILLQHHHCSALFHHTYEVLAQQPADSPVSIHQQRYNLPTVSEIAAIVPGDGTQVTDSRDIKIHDGHRSYACLHYVLFFPHGEDGWYWDLTMHQPDKEKPNRLSQVHYAAFRLFSCEMEFSQWLVDTFAISDQNCLTYLCLNQGKLQASLYSGLEDSVTSAGNDNVDLHKLSQHYILPSSYTGGPQSMYQCYQDGLALVHYFKKIDIFIMVTCNPKWPEIKQELLSDLVARVKKQAIVDDVYKKGVFGQTVAYIYTIEFQKQGLPHMHMLIFLEQSDKLLTPIDIDMTIWA
ncbi:hypothetical protein BDR06DRAFT_984537 [Suillus hirtellus]|nr:hypothetical protein BDR06DRAFT_984537 [Suillus hirtellus]